jgi:L-amino acid N-acyltransferase YncA
MNTKIRVASENDADAIATIHVASWQAIYKGHIPDSVLQHLSIKERAERWRALIKNNVKILVIELNNQMAGFASIGPSRDADAKNSGEISAIYFHPNFWRKGLGRMLGESACDELKKMGFNDVTVWVLDKNVQARRFYESIGFSNTGDMKLDEYEKNVHLNEIRYRRKL